MKDLIKVEGQAQAFAEMEYVKHVIIIEHGQRKILDSNFCIGRIQQIMHKTKSHTKKWKDDKHILNMMLMNQKHIIDKFDEIDKKVTPSIFNKFIAKLRQQVPSKFFKDKVMELKYFPMSLPSWEKPITGSSTHALKYFKLYFKPEAVFIETVNVHADLLISYLKQDKKNIKIRVWNYDIEKEQIINFFVEATKYKDNQDFNKYIENWAQRLMKENTLSPDTWQWRKEDGSKQIK